MRKRAIESVLALLPKSKFDLIAEMCDLTPVEGWRLWESPVGHRIRVMDNMLSIKPTKSPNYENVLDLYFKAPPQDIIHNSYWFLYIGGVPFSSVWLIGYDGRLRQMLVSDDEIVNIEPILSSINVLRFVAKNFESTGERTLNKMNCGSPTYGRSFDEFQIAIYGDNMNTIRSLLNVW